MWHSISLHSQTTISQPHDLPAPQFLPSFFNHSYFTPTLSTKIKKSTETHRKKILRPIQLFRELFSSLFCLTPWPWLQGHPLCCQEISRILVPLIQPFPIPLNLSLFLTPFHFSPIFLSRMFHRFCLLYLLSGPHLLPVLLPQLLLTHPNSRWTMLVYVSKWDCDFLGPNWCKWCFFFQIKSVPTQPIEGQKTGTSGLRKKVQCFFSHCLLMSATMSDHV